LDRGSATIFRQEGGVNIEAAETWQIQNSLGQNLPVSGDCDQIRLEGLEGPDESFISGTLGLQDGQSTRHCRLFDRRRLQLEIATFWPVRLSGYRNELKIRLGEESIQADTGELGSAMKIIRNAAIAQGNGKTAKGESKKRCPCRREAAGAFSEPLKRAGMVYLISV